MKSLLILRFLLVLFTLALIQVTVFAQQKFLIHEDQVNTDKLMQYEETAAALHQVLTEHQIDMNYTTAMTNDLRYLYITPIENFAAMDNMDGPWNMLTEKAGKEKMDMIWSKFDECYDVHRNYITTLSEELSYYPSGEIMSDGGGQYRKWTYIYGHQDKLSELYEVSKKWKALYAKHGIERGYRVYHSGLGNEIGVMIIVDYGKDIADIVSHEQAVQAKIGEEGKRLWAESIQYVRKVDEVYGQMRPDLSYSMKK